MAASVKGELREMVPYIPRDGSFRVACGDDKAAQTTKTSWSSTRRRKTFSQSEQRTWTGRASNSADAPSLASSSISSDSISSISECEDTEKHHSLQGSLLSILHPSRFAAKSTLPWGHRPHPAVGVSCLLFLLPIPFLQTCFPLTAAAFGVTTLSSFLSDHVYSGVDSLAHLADRLTAPITLLLALWAVYVTSGTVWASSSSLAVACYVLAHKAGKMGNYESFVLWHSMWHAVGVGLMVACFCCNDIVSFCTSPKSETLEANLNFGMWES